MTVSTPIALFACLSLLVVFSSAQEPGAHGIVRKHSLDPDRPGDEPVDLAVVRNGVEFVVLHRESTDLSFHRASDGEFLASVELGGLPWRAAATADGARVVVVDAVHDEAIVVDVAGRAVEARIALPTAGPIEVLITPNGRQAVIIPRASTSGSVVTLLDLATNSVAGSIQLAGGGPHGFNSDDAAVLSGDGSSLLLLGSPARVVDLASGTARWTASGALASAVAGWLNPAGDRAVIVTSGPGFGKYLWSIDVVQGTKVQVGILQNNESATRLTVTDDGRHAVFGSGAGLLFADLLLGTTTRVSGVRGDALAASADSETIVVNTLDEHVLFDVRTAAEIARFPTSWVSPTVASATIGGHVLFLDSFSERAARLDLDPLGPGALWTHSTGQGIEFDGVSTAGLAAGGALVGTTSSRSWNIVFQDPATGQCAGSLQFQRPILSSAIGGNIALVNLGLPGCKGPGTLELWTVDGLSMLAAIPVAACGSALAVTPSGAFAIGADRPGVGPFELIVIDTANPSGGAGYRATLPVDVGPTGGILSPGGRWLALRGSSGSSGAEWHLFDLALGQIVQSFEAAGREAIAFSSDDKRLFVGSNTSGNAVVELDLSLGIPAEVGRYPMPPGLFLPVDVEVDERSGRVWVMGLSGLAFFDQAASGVFTWLPASTHDAHLRVLGPHAIVTRAGHYQRFFVREAGPSLEVVEIVDDTAIPAPHFTTGPLLDPQRGLLSWVDRTSDELYVLDLGSTRPVAYCDGGPGQPRLTATGPFVANGTSFDLVAAGVPGGTFGFPLIGTGAGQFPLPNGICIGAPLRRWTTQLSRADASGVLRIRAFPDDLPLGAGTGAHHGESWRFQMWYRGGATPGSSALTNALEIYFR